MKAVILVALIAFAMGANAQYYPLVLPSGGLREPVGLPQSPLAGQYPYYPYPYRPIVIRPPIESSSIYPVVPGLSSYPATLSFLGARPKLV